MRISCSAIAFIVGMLLAGCSLPEPRLPVGTERVGLVLHTPSNLLCYHYRGMMVWQNEMKRYELPVDFHAEFLALIREEMKLQGLDVVLIDPMEFSASGSPWLQQSAWDSAASIVPEYLDQFRGVADKHQIDAILVDSGILDSDSKGPEDCRGAVHVYFVPDGPLEFSAGQFFLLDAAGRYQTRFMITRTAADAGLVPLPKDLDAATVARINSAILEAARVKIRAVRVGG